MSRLLLGLAALSLLSFLVLLSDLVGLQNAIPVVIVLLTFALVDSSLVLESSARAGLSFLCFSEIRAQRILPVVSLFEFFVYIGRTNEFQAHFA